MFSQALGLVYEGESLAGMMHGKGVLTNKGAACDKRDYALSPSNDFWIYMYQGDFVQDKLHGTGALMRYSNRKRAYVEQRQSPSERALSV